ncbi:MAG: fused signal recognition particle receptor [Pseudonocardiales bacterium]|nr:fused signal recognition particle receptor [Pseudonocardiales bacterium]
MLAIIVTVVVLLVLAAVLVVGFVVPRVRRGRGELPSPPVRSTGGTATKPPVESAAPAPPELSVAPAPPAVETAPPGPVLDVPEPTAGRMQRLRARLARSQTSLGRGLLSVLSRDKLDDDAWDEIEEALLTADVGLKSTTEIVDRLRTRTQILGTRSQGELRALLSEELVTALRPELDRTLHTVPTGSGPAVVMVVGVNGTGKTTTCGKLARVLVADGRTVLLGAADTFRAAAADQLQTWGARVGAETIRGPEGGDPASVAFEAVKAGKEAGVDAVLIDTAGRLHTKVGLMDELGKVKRVVEKHGPIDETLLVLDATTGQNGLTQARVFLEVAEVTGVVLTKLDGTAKGGIVISVQAELGVPVKLIGLGEGVDDLAPFDPEQFVDALLGDVVG